MRRALASVLLGVAAVVAVPAAPASAHATLVSTDPAEGAVLPEAPEQVTFTFDEQVSLTPDGLQVYDAEGQPVDADASSRDTEVIGDLPEELDDGTYVVTWRVVSADGHPIAGSLTFHVGAPSGRVVLPDQSDGGSGPLETVVSIVQGLTYVALLVAAGLVLFVGWPLRGIRLGDDAERRLGRVLKTSVGAALLLSAVAIPLSGAYQRGEGVGGVLALESLDLTLVGGDVTVLIMVALGFLVAIATRPGPGAQPSMLSDLGALLAVWSPAMVGHTRAYEPTQLVVLTDAIHLTAGAVWLGGLVGLAVVLAALRGRPGEAATVLARFSTLGAGALAVLAATGTLLAWRMLGSWAGLVETGYGRLLLLKLGVAALVAAVAGWNRFRLLPRVADVGARGTQALTLVRRAVAAEALLLVALLGVTGFLVEQPPRGDGAAAPATADTGVATAVAADLKVLAVLDSGSGRQRRLMVQVQDPAGEPVDLLGAPSVSLRTGDVDLGVVPVEPVGAGTYAADVTFPTLGEWEVQVSLPKDEFESPVTTLTIEVR
ncbi:MAG TPA: copper resistance protein CopC [Nocardioides sp.]|nr:copper resistance protein CopC [Nocardioides sp.]